jgi:hypothetical protein
VQSWVERSGWHLLDNAPIPTESDTEPTPLPTPPPSSSSNITIDSPLNETFWSKSSFPQAVDFHLVDPTAYQRIEVSFIGLDGIRRLVGIEPAPNANPIHMNIALGPPAGRYRLEIAGYRIDGSSDQTSVYVNIVP